MRLASVVASLVMCFTFGNASDFSVAAELAFPYRASVRGGHVPIRSGPGEEFYETDRLSEGDQVEVYRHDSGGWCAIRPPAESFSWVPADRLELTENPSLARVVVVPTKTRIGSVLSDIHDVEYISLREGEIVELLGSKALSGPSTRAPQSWFKIAPPAGEFRWIHNSQLVRSNSETTASEVPPPVPSPNDQTAQQPVTIETFPLESPEATSQPVETPPSVDVNPERRVPVIRASFQNQADMAEPQSAVATPTVSAATNDSSVHHSPTNHANIESDTVTWRAVAAPTDPLSAPEPSSFEVKFRALNVMLSRTVLAEVDQWDLEPIQQQTKLLAELATTAEQHAKVQSFLSKLGQFADLQQRRQRIEQQPSNFVASANHLQPATTSVLAKPNPMPPVKVDGTIPPNPEMPVILGRQRASNASQPIPVPTGTSANVDNSIFDGTGTLISVVSRRQGLPELALTDSKGRILKFVTPPPGRNAFSLVNKQVGVIGQSSYLRELNKPHITARRIVPLQR